MHQVTKDLLELNKQLLAVDESKLAKAVSLDELVVFEEILNKCKRLLLDAVMAEGIHVVERGA